MPQDGTPNTSAPTSSSAGVLGSVITGASGILGDIFNLFGQNKANREAEAYQTSVMDQQRQWSLQDTAAANLYNSPAQQMARLKAGGLNPNLIYGEGINAAGSFDTPRAVPSASYTPQNTLSSFSNLGSQVSDALQRGQDIRKTAQETENLGASYNQTVAQTSAQNMQNEITAMRPEFKGIITHDKDGTVVRVTGQQYVRDMAASDYTGKQLDNDIKSNLADKGFSEAQSAAIQASINQALKSTNIQTGMQELENLKSSQALTEAQRKNVSETLEQIKNTKQLQKLEMSKMQNDFGNNPTLKAIFHAAVMLFAAAL